MLIYEYIRIRPNQYSEDKHEVMLILKTNQMWRLCKCNANRKHSKQKLGGGVTLQCLHTWFGFELNIYMLVFCPLQHSLIAISSCWIFWTKWMWSDPNLSMLPTSNSVYPNHMHSVETVECLLCVLVSRRQRGKHLNLFLKPYLFAWMPEKQEWPPDNPGVRGNVEQLSMSCMFATCPSDVNRQGHLRNCAVLSLSL